MTLLALEFSAGDRSVAVLRRLADGVQTRALAELREARTTSRGPLGVIAEALEAARVKREEIEGVVVGLGPGSYTGIRSAIALAQGWQLARPSVRVAGVSSCEGLALACVHRQWRGRVQVVIDAQRDDLYAQTFEIGETGFKSTGTLKLAKPEAVREELEADTMVVGPEADRWFPEARLLRPEAAALGRLALAADEWIQASDLVPIYLREPSFVKAPPPRRWD